MAAFASTEDKKEDCVKLASMLLRLFGVQETMVYAINYIIFFSG